MTKVSVFGQENEVKKDLKKIEFVKHLSSYGTIKNTSAQASEWSEVKLLEKGYTAKGLDLIMAWNNIDDKVIYLGHWNDGVV